MRATWRVILEGSRSEALLAVGLYNEPGGKRHLEAFYVHMHLAWLYLFHARLRRQGVNYHYRLSNGRYVRVDGEPKAWDLEKCMSYGWRTPEDPVRKNLELTVALRNKIEHRYAEAIAQYTAGKAHALVVNYEEELVAAFGVRHSLAEELRFPIYVAAFTAEGIRQASESRGRVPSRLSTFIAEFEAGLEPRVVEDVRYDLRIHLIPQLGPKTEADLALRFVRDDALTNEQRSVLAQLGKTGTVIVRERMRDVVNLRHYKASEAARLIESSIPFKFSVFGAFTFAWKKLGVRPPAGDPHPERTDERYCLYDRAHDDYLYTQAYVDKLVNACQTAAGYEDVVGRRPTAKDSDMPAGA